MVDPWRGAARVVSEGQADFEACASCHLADAGGRPDGAIPRLAGQLPSVTAARLRAIASGSIDLPVMLPFARALDEAQIDRLSAWLAELPAPAEVGHGDGSALALGAETFGARCAACHGPGGEGDANLGAPRLCGQHAGALERRLDPGEIALRGGFSRSMAEVAATLGPAERAAVADFLSRQTCE